MPFYECRISGGMPEKVTITGTLHAGFDYGASNTNCTGNTSIAIPTLGYKKADITASSSTVGTGSNIDISAIDSITITRSVSPPSSYHQEYGRWMSISGTDASYTVVLHN